MTADEYVRECWRRGWRVIVTPVRRDEPWADDSVFVAQVGPTDRSGRRYKLGYGSSEAQALRDAIERVE